MDDINETTFVAVAGRQFPGASRTQLVSIGREACRVMDDLQPSSMEELGLALMSSGLSSPEDMRMAGTVFGAASVAFCPQWNWLF